jgi:hypothetical protein
MVRMERVELSRSDEHSVLSAVRLPFRHIREKKRRRCSGILGATHYTGLARSSVGLNPHGSSHRPTSPVLVAGVRVELTA